MTPETRQAIEAELTAMPREKKILIYLMGAIRHLKETGRVEGGSFEATEKGMGAYEVMQEQGFTPTEEETKWGLHAIQHLMLK